MRRSAVTITCLAALVAPSAASAQEPAAGTAPVVSAAGAGTAPVGSAAGAGGKMSLSIANGQRTRKRVYFTRGQTVLLRGRARPFVAGQSAVVEFVRRGRIFARKRVPIRGGGLVSYRFKVKRSGPMKLRARHRATPQQGAFRSRFVRLSAGAYRAGAGVRGPRVVLLQRSLKRMGFAVPVTGYYDGGTARAVTAYRKTNGLGRDGYATPRVYRRVFRNRGAFKVRFPKAGRHVEFDWSRQVLALIDKGRPRRVYHASSGTPATPTVFGRFSFYRKQPGTNSLGMVHSNYFIGGYAIHGYHSVPNYPASHGCIRVPIPNAAQIDRQIDLGQTVFVYR